MDENPGLWCCGLDIVYNPSYFQLGDVENGEVFSDAAFVKSRITPTGNYRFYAQYNTDENTDKTGVLATFYFKILEAAPNGSHNISIKLPDGEWILKVLPGYKQEDVTVHIGDAATIKVTDSTATAPVKDKDGKYVTEIVTSVVTDSNGDTQYDEAGNPVTEIVTETVPVPESTQPENEDETQKNVGTKRIILTVGIILLVVAAGIILVILYNARKNGKGPGNDGESGSEPSSDSSNKNTDTASKE